MAATLTQDYAKIRETAREAREDTNAALATVKDVENKLGPLARLHELSQSTEERLTTLNALAEHVSHKAKALESQQQAVEHAVVQANRVNEMVWSMDVQIGKLNEGMKQVVEGRGDVRRIEKLTQETNAQLETAAQAPPGSRARNGQAHERRDGTARNRAQPGRHAAVKKKEFEAFDERLRALQSSVGDAEVRMSALGRERQEPRRAGQKIDSLTKRFEALFAQADDLTKKQLALEALHERLGQVDDLPKKTVWQMDSLRQSRQDLDVLRKEIQDFYKSHAEIAKLARQAGGDRLGARSVRRTHDGVLRPGAGARGARWTPSSAS